ncbi:hypothetical protein ZIOFF_074834 [Zingiber officinale]|uniref:Uncharacterized protein n=1 Tax=Zingiber officinale TaxID=94328 RepID=A0A8J5BUL7_ZINOF|nr:hypothetical protein ZIOFF_074834 [Zingiber officinale]
MLVVAGDENGEEDFIRVRLVLLVDSTGGHSLIFPKSYLKSRRSYGLCLKAAGILDVREAKFWLHELQWRLLGNTRRDREKGNRMLMSHAEIFGKVEKKSLIEQKSEKGEMSKSVDIQCLPEAWTLIRESGTAVPMLLLHLHCLPFQLIRLKRSVKSEVIEKRVKELCTAATKCYETTRRVLGMYSLLSSSSVPPKQPKSLLDPWFHKTSEPVTL